MLRAPRLRAPRPRPPRPPAFRSPLRGPWLTSVFGVVLLAALPLVVLTGLLDYVAYGPRFGQAYPAGVGWLHPPLFDWPTRPAWLFQLTQGMHVILGLVLIPVVLAKLWSVVPKLFVWPPFRSAAQLVERLSLVLLVGGVLFEIVTGVLNIQYDYVFRFDFYTAHYYGAWVFTAAFVVHVGIKLPRMVRALRSRRETAADPDGLVPAEPGPVTISRRGALALVGGASLLLAVLSVGQSLGGASRRAVLLLPRGRSYGDGPGDFQVNRSAAAAGITTDATGAGWRLTLTGPAGSSTVDRARLAAMAQHTVRLPIACVEGWATTQTWTGVPLRDLAALAGVPDPGSAHVRSLERAGQFNQATLQRNQILHPDALLALRVNGIDLPVDHGYPARVIVPALPGVHCTKWVRGIEFRRA